MARFSQPVRKVSAVFIKTKIDGADVYVREPFNIVALEWGDSTPVRTYMEPAGVLLKQPSPDDALARADASERAEVFNEIRIYDRPPYPTSRWGVQVV